MGMLTARLQGGLGNQMFIAAAAAIMARRLQIPLTLDVSWYRTDVLRDLELQHFPAFESTPLTHAAFSRKRRIVDTARRKLHLDDPHLFRQLGFTFDPQFMQASGIERITGYFQSRHYLTPEADYVRELFALPEEPPLLKYIRSEVGARFMAMHVRRGDYLFPGNHHVHGVCDELYYLRAWQLLHELGVDDLPLVVFTDSPEALPKSIGRASAMVVGGEAGRPAAHDMLALAGAESLVLSNSSFSWWAAFLGGHDTEGRVVAPRPWMRRGDVAASELLFPDWITLGASA